MQTKVSKWRRLYKTEIRVINAHNMIDWTEETILEGKKVRLVPLAIEQKAALLEAAKDGSLWKLWYTSVPSADTVTEYIDTAIDQFHNKASIPFAVVDKATNSIIGSTRFCNIDNISNRVEIGYTWYAQSYQKTGINTECKYLLLKKAFEEYNVIAVEFRTHWFNHDSRNAILKLGAKQDGILRSHKRDKQGNLRDTVVFSIIQSEWNTVKSSLEFKIKNYEV